MSDEHRDLETNHERIWLSPRCEDERTWCQDDQGPCDECGAPSVEYVRADILAALSARNAALEKLLRDVVVALREDKSLVRNPAFESDDVAWFLEHIDAALFPIPAEPR